MSRPRLLDLFCGGGGASMGYHLAGFDVTGVDVEPQPDYPFEFEQMDALSVLRTMRDYPTFSGEMWRPGYFHAIHASPPCQAYSLASRYNGRTYPDLVGPVRELLASLRVPWVIENVPGAPLRPDIKLCGCMFALELPGRGQLRRERWFETSWGEFALDPPHHHYLPAISIAGHGTPQWMRARTGHIGVADWRRVMGIGWMTRDQLTEAIPPAYTEHVGAALLNRLGRTEVAA